MSPLETSIRAACRHIAAPEDAWEGFAELGRVALSAFIGALPPDLAEAVRAHLDKET
ncbi:hypothetical protein [Phenylobacterium sp.]|uniref:hypothetical protein n=1 Tax=Phenylobacterium sp. TaxID=1871053 RepID=UPI003919D01C